MDLVVVESPAKAKTIQKYLGRGYEVVASYGHVRDLPSKDGSVRPDSDFAMIWDVDPKAAKRLREIADKAKKSDKLILATDPDREGEAISWHVLEALREKGLSKKLPVERVVFNAVTKKAILDAMSHPREIDRELVEAYLARRALDYLVGFTLSPVLWRKLPGSRSAGRVQSVALRLVCDRELEIEKFIREEYWSLEALLRNARGEEFAARLVELQGQKLKKFDLKNEGDALLAKTAIERAPWVVSSIERKPAKRHPAPPFTTSTLQQEAARKLGFSAKHTMSVAQRLYEGVQIGGETTGLITYMRTDGVTIIPEAVSEIRTLVGKDYGAKYVPDVPRAYSSKAKNAQEAHEAIRPTDITMRPGDLGRSLDGDQAKLYELIWKRALASQMQSAEMERTTIDIDSGNGAALLRATGTVVTFDGFLALYQEGVDDSDDDENRRLPALNEGESLSLIEAKPAQHFTEPPPRYTEATLVKKLEELGIGRPSTYASILSVLRDRSYVRMERNRFIPEDKGRVVTAFLESFFKRYVEYDFTADLEQQLDRVSAGELDWKALLRDFWQAFARAVEDISDLKVSDVLEALNEILAPHIFPPSPQGGDPRLCPSCGIGRLSLKLGKFGAFLGCSNYPDCNFTRAMGLPQDDAPTTETKILGIDPDTNEEITLRSGRFGPYLQRGNGKDKEKPKRAGIPKDVPLADVDFERARALLALPREVGIHPETKTPIMAGIGRYGPYLHHDKQYANLASTEEVFTVGINRAVTLLAERKERGPRRESQVLRDIGVHPDDGKPVRVMKGRYGPYVKHEDINATLPRDMTPEAVTLDEALRLLAEREARGPVRKKRPARKQSNGKAASGDAKFKPKTAKARGKSKKNAGPSADESAEPVPEKRPAGKR